MFDTPRDIGPRGLTPRPGRTEHTHAENVALARKLAIEYRKPVTIWQDGTFEYVRVGDPTSDAEAARQGWHWITLVRPPKEI